MKMIVGLGNIGTKYAHTRHNVGFDVVDEYARHRQTAIMNNDYHAMIGSFFADGEKVLLVKPTTFMNESGQAVRALMDYYQIPLEDILIVHDDMDLPVGKLRLRHNGSAGGHNGIKSVIAHTKSKEFARMRIGIAHPKQQSVVDWVLGRFTPDQQAEITAAMPQLMSALDDWVAGMPFQKLMNQYNHRK